MNLRDQPWKMFILWCRTDICSCKFPAKVSWMLDIPFLVTSLCKLNHINPYFIQISTKLPANCLFPSGKAMFFLKSSRCFEPLGKFQHTIKISIKTARVWRLSVSCDYVLMDKQNDTCSLNNSFIKLLKHIRHENSGSLK